MDHVYTPPWGWIPVDLTYTNENDPLEIVKNAPEYTPNVVSAINVSKQNYTTLSVKTRQRIISSSIYITSTETIDEIHVNWINPTIWHLGIIVVVNHRIMFYASWRPRQREL